MESAVPADATETESRVLSTDELDFRQYLVQSGAAKEIIKVLTALGETPDAQPLPMPFIVEHFGQGTVPDVCKQRGSEMDDADLAAFLAKENAELRRRAAELKEELRATRQAIEDALPEGTLQIFDISAKDVPDAVPSKFNPFPDKCDPYIRISLLDAPSLEEDEFGVSAVPDSMNDPIAFAEYCDRHNIAKSTSTKMNERNPVWDDEVLELVLPGGTPRPPRVLVRVWDDDKKADHDPLASAELQLEPLGGKVEDFALKGRMQEDGECLADVLVSFTYKVLEPENVSVS